MISFLPYKKPFDEFTKNIPLLLFKHKLSAVPIQLLKEAICAS